MTRQPFYILAWDSYWIYVALIFFVAAVATLISSLRFSLGSVPVSATILRIESDSTGDSISYHPVFAFKDATGARREIRSDIGVSRNAYAPGSSVTVSYLPDRPSDARIDSPFGLWLPPIAFAFGAIYCLLHTSRHLGSKA